MCQALKTQVRVLLSTVQQFISRLPASKQDQNKISMQQMIRKYNPNNTDELKKLEKDLHFKINFLKLSYPNLVSFKSENQQETMEQQGEQLLKEHSIQYTNQQEENQSQHKDNIESSEPITAGKYIMKDGKLVKGEAVKREHVDWSNWFAANVDPEDLKKHKELMDRQHFGGPVWQGKGRPKSIIEEESPVYELGQKELNPYLKKDKDPVFENVKR